MQLSNGPALPSVLNRPDKDNPSSGYGLGFTPSDCLVYMHIDLGKLEKEDQFRHYFLPLGNVVQFSLSSHRDKFPISVLGRIAPRGFTAGHRTIAGSIVISGSGSEALDFLRSLYRSLAGSPSGYIHTDEVLPFNIMLIFLNESGQFAYIVLKHVTILDEGTSLSVDEPAYYVSMSYMALDYELFDSTNAVGTSAPLSVRVTMPEIRVTYDSNIQIAQVDANATSTNNTRITGVPYPGQPFGQRDVQPEMPGTYMDDAGSMIDPLAPRRFFPFWDSLLSGEVGSVAVPVTEDITQYLPSYLKLDEPVFPNAFTSHLNPEDVFDSFGISRKRAVPLMPRTPIVTPVKPYTPRPGYLAAVVPSLHPFMYLWSVVQGYYFPSNSYKVRDVVTGAEYTVTLPMPESSGPLTSVVDTHPIPPRSKMKQQQRIR